MNKESDDLKIFEQEGDLFDLDNTISLCHCVSEDLKMGAGIALKFKEEFKRVGSLINQNKIVGECAYLVDNKINQDLNAKKLEPKRYIFYLITKKRYSFKPNYSDLQKSLQSMKLLIEDFKVNKIGMPKLGCGLDCLNWTKVKDIIIEVFRNVKLEIYVVSPPNSHNKSNFFSYIPYDSLKEKKNIRKDNFGKFNKAKEDSLISKKKKRMESNKK